MPPTDFEKEAPESPNGIAGAWLVALVIIGLAVTAMAVILLQFAYYQRGELWPLPGLFFIIATGAGLVGASGVWLVMRGERSTGASLLWAGGGVLLGAGAVGLWTVGMLLLAVAMLLIIAGAAADWGYGRRLLLHLPLMLALAAVSGLGVPLLDRLDTIGAPPLVVTGTNPVPSAADVPLDTTVVVEVGPLDADRPLITSMTVYYADAGLLWLRPQPEGFASGSWGVDGEQRGTFTFRSQEGFEPCRRIGVEVDVSGYKRYSYTFETACPGRSK